MTGLIILAAGSSSRLGTPKQNLVFQGTTLLQRTIRTALDSNCEKVIVVLGANAELIEPTLADEHVQILHNPGWQEGMASSIRIGIAEMQLAPQVTSVILMLCDQPFADAAIINQLIKTSANGKNMVASTYNGTVGPPALFSQHYFAELLSLKGNDGAKKLLQKHADDVATVPFPLGVIDIDTIGDYEQLEDNI